MMKPVLTFSLAVIATAFLSSCNTVSGVGKDVSSVGNAMGEAAKDTSKAIDREVDKM